MHGLFIINGGYEVCIADVMNPRNVFVADTFNAMLTESELQQGRTLQRFGGDDAYARMLRAQVVARGNSASRAGGTDVRGQAATILIIVLMEISSSSSGGLSVRIF